MRTGRGRLPPRGGEPWRNMYRLQRDASGPAGSALGWRTIVADGRAEQLPKGPHDLAWKRFVHWPQSLLVNKELP